ncbi:protein translocase subunit SecD, partial [Candidatus Gottesmanbacteria bacterium]|nr:protein translocase subunit SecD [Candidatus Gottesmanbacteria bacterium]
MRNNWKLIIFILVLTGLAGVVNFKKEIKRGLDLAGGTAVVLQADMTKISSPDRDQSLDSLKSIIERRVNLYGVSEPVIQTIKTGGDFRINVELAGVTDINQALSLIGKTAQLGFYEETSSAAAVLTGKDLLKAQATFDPNKNEPVVALTFNSEGAKKWETLTKKNLNKKIIITLDDKILLAPTVISVIADGKTIITGGFTAQTAKEMATLLNSGALPAPVKVLSQKVIPATLGKESIDKSFLAGAVGLTAVAIFMVISYGKLGLVADLALIIYALLTLAVFKLIPV